MSSNSQPMVQVAAADGALGLPVVIGVPFPQGAVVDAAQLGLVSPAGQPLPVAARSLVNWADGSLRWGLLAFQAKETGAHSVSMSGTAMAVQQPVTLATAGSTTTLDNGLVRVVLDTAGPGPIREIIALGHRYLAKPDDLRFVVDQADTTHENSARTVEVLEQSPLRVRVRIAGAHYDTTGARLLHYRLDVELWAGWPTLRLEYQFFNLEPRREEIAIERMAMECRLNLAGDTRRHFVQNNWGLNFIPREIVNPAPVAIVTDETCGPPHVEDPAMLLDEVQYPSHLRPPLTPSSDWLGVGDGQRSLYLRMRDFMEMRPKRLASDGASLALEFWPASQETLELPQGRSRRMTMTFAFSDAPQLAPAQAEQLLNGPLHEGRAVIDPAWLRATGEFEIDRLMTPAANIRFEKYLAKLVNLITPQDMFDLGDTIDSGYCRTYIPVPNNIPRKKNAPELPVVYQASTHSPVVDWALPQLFEPVWTNNEYDSIYALCSELMRAGKGELWTLARWFVRHNIEVDFIHYHDDQQQNRGCPQHSCRHNRSGAIPSHFWTQGLLQYYCMTGDPDVLEVATALGDKIIEDFTDPALRQSFWTFTRELGWPTLALSQLYNITGEERFRRQLEEVLDYFVSYDRGPRPAAGQPSELERGIAWGLTFWYCVFEGTDLYIRHVENAKVKAWLLEFLDYTLIALEGLLREGKPVSIQTNVVMAIGYEMTGDPRYLQVGMACIDEFMDSSLWLSPPAETKPMAIIYRGLPRFLHHAHAAGLLDRLEYPSARG